MITESRLKEVLTFNPATGEFHWTEKARWKHHIGKLAGTTQSNGYHYVKIDRTVYLAHRLAWLYVTGEWPKNSIDHINGVRTDNRIANLRDVSAAANAQNLRAPMANSKTGVLGVSWKASCKKYVAQITVNGKVRYIGLFDDTATAHAAYLDAKRVLHPGCTI